MVEPLEQVKLEEQVEQEEQAELVEPMRRSSFMVTRD